MANDKGTPEQVAAPYCQQVIFTAGWGRLQVCAFAFPFDFSLYLTDNQHCSLEYQFASDFS